MHKQATQLENEAAKIYKAAKGAEGVDARQLALFRTKVEEAVQRLDNALNPSPSPFDE